MSKNNTYPYTPAHAIARLDFALVFQTELASEQQIELGQLLEQHLEQFERRESSDEDEQVIVFERKGEDDDVTEEIHVHGNYAHVVWSDYRGWTFCRDGVIDYLSPILNYIRAGKLSLESLGLAYRDVFFNDDVDTYRADEALRKGNSYLPSKVFDVGRNWRHSLVWKEPSAGTNDLAIQSMLRVEATQGTIEEDNVTFHCTEIVHRQEVRWNREAVLTNPSDEDLRNAWNCAHQLNRGMIRELVSDAMLERIGLKEGANECPLPN